MPPQTLAGRVGKLEERVTFLEQLPARMDALESQILQMREEIRGEFSAVRSEFREEIRAGDAAVVQQLREEIRAGDERILTQARLLHEEVIARLALIGEGRSGPARRKRR